jgi:hypothetical protein
MTRDELYDAMRAQETATESGRAAFVRLLEEYQALDGRGVPLLRWVDETDPVEQLELLRLLEDDDEDQQIQRASA